MASQVTNYKCPACTAPLHFVGASGKLECDFCGSKYDVAEIEALYAGKEAKAVEASKQASAKAEEIRRKMADMAADGWDTSSLSSDWGAEADVYVTAEGLDLTERYDRYTHTTETRVRKNTRDDHDSGGKF